MNERDAEPLAQLGELLDEPVDRADEHVRRREELVHVDLDAGPRPDPVEDVRRPRARVVGDHRRAPVG